jgi:hypothetical protein
VSVPPVVTAGRAPSRTAVRPALHASVLFHLNLSYSSIDEDRHGEVIARCYRPLLGLLERVPGLRLSLEASGHTLERIAALDPGWLEELRARVAEGRVELIGSGDTQLIGPLVPASVNRWNQLLGMETYERLVGVRPTTALVSEMAWSQGLVEAYLEAGYEAVCTEWHNPRRAHPEWGDDARWRTCTTAGPSGRSIGLHFVDAIAFQKFERAAVGDLERAEWLAWLEEQHLVWEEDAPARHLFLYGNDAEVLDHRPGRYATEPALDPAGEWENAAALLEAAADAEVAFTTPSAVRAAGEVPAGPELTLTSLADPAPVKKQPKYNLTRWALSGRDDVGLNARCFGAERELTRAYAGPDAWRALCRAWASDHRTHLTQRRWDTLGLRDRPLGGVRDRPLGGVRGLPPLRPTSRTRALRSGRTLALETDGVSVLLDARRGMAVRRLAFGAHDGQALVGTLPHGTFDHIDWAADFYTGHVVAELPARGRVTDLEPCEPEVTERDGLLVAAASVPTSLGELPERVTLGAGELELSYELSALGERPMGALRVAAVTLQPDGLGPLTVRCAQGGAEERFVAPEAGTDVDHGAGVSSLVSARAALGATDGRLVLEDGERGLELAWDPAHAAALPMLSHGVVDGRRWCRVVFSLAELDDTHRPGAPLLDFALRIRPWRPESDRPVGETAR